MGYRHIINKNAWRNRTFCTFLFIVCGAGHHLVGVRTMLSSQGHCTSRWGPNKITVGIENPVTEPEHPMYRTMHTLWKAWITFKNASLRFKTCFTLKYWYFAFYLKNRHSRTYTKMYFVIVLGKGRLFGTAINQLAKILLNWHSSGYILLNKSLARILIRCPTLNEHEPFYLM